MTKQLDPPIWLNAFIENSGDSLWGVDSDMRVVFFNQNFANLLTKVSGCKVEINKYFPDLCLLDRQKIWIDRILRALKNESFTVFDVIKSGEKSFYIEIQFKPVLDNENVVGVVCQATDHTNQKLNETSLLESEEMFRRIFDHAHIAISIQTKDKILLVNKAWEKITGYSQGEINLISPIDLVHPDKRVQISNLDIERLGGRETPENYEFHLITKDQKEKWIDLHASLIKIEGKNAVLLMGSDITQKKETENLVKKLSAAVTNSPSSIVITDKNAFIEYVNPHFCQFTGYSFDEVIGKDPKILQSGNTPVETYKDMWKTILKKQVWVGEFENKKKNGEIYWENARIAPLIGANDEITNFVAVKEDITEMKFAQKKLLETANELREMNAKKDKFFSIIAHDLRSPFVGLMELSRLLYTNIQEMEPQRVEYFLKLLNESSQNVFHLLENLLEWSKTQTGRIEYQPSKINLRAVAEESFNLILLNAQNKEIGLFNRIDINLWVLADRNMLLTIIRNLIGNAWKYTPRGGQISISSDVSASEPGKVKIIVTDTGVGIPVNVQNKIFKIEENYSTPGTEKEKGSGLGLILCKEFVEKHGGRIWCQSDGKNGTTFLFTIPLVH
jgi:PAS domain S-box-containing protein